MTEQIITREPWEMTRSEFHVSILYQTAQNLESAGCTRPGNGYATARNMLKTEHCDFSHHLHVQQAILRGDLVPGNILREYCGEGEK